jgi:predicted DNA-binding protein (UPF0251 family)
LAYANIETRDRRMTRPCKCRSISTQPRSFLFKPCGIPWRELKETCLTLDELEAVRLADLEELYQEEAARRMGVSRQTFGNIIRSAHGKIADVLVNAKSLKIAGGVVQLDRQRFRCGRCRSHWAASPDREKAGTCPKCHGNGIPEGPAADAGTLSASKPNKEKQP